MVPENIHTPPLESNWKFLGGEGVLKDKLLEETIKLNQNFLGAGWGGRGGGNAK